MFYKFSGIFYFHITLFSLYFILFRLERTRFEIHTFWCLNNNFWQSNIHIFDAKENSRLSFSFYVPKDFIGLFNRTTRAAQKGPFAPNTKMTSIYYIYPGNSNNSFLVLMNVAFGVNNSRSFTLFKMTIDVPSSKLKNLCLYTSG